MIVLIQAIKGVNSARRISSTNAFSADAHDAHGDGSDGSG